MRQRVKILLLLFSLALSSPGRGATHEMDPPSHLRAVCLYSPEPEYPYAVYSRGVRGIGNYRLSIDPKTGKVTEVKVLKHARFAILDQLAAKALLQWRFRPGTIAQATIEYEFSVSGFSRQVH